MTVNTSHCEVLDINNVHVLLELVLSLLKRV